MASNKIESSNEKVTDHIFNENDIILMNKKDLKLFAKLQIKKRNFFADIRFINLCIKHKITPTFVRKTVKFDNNSKAQLAADKKILQIERSKHYRNISDLEITLYGLHLKLSKNLGEILWKNFTENILTGICGKMKAKTSKLKSKFSKLKAKYRPKENAKLAKTRGDYLEATQGNNVINLSNKPLTQKETEFLNYGLKTCVGYSNNIDEYIADINIATHNLNEMEKSTIKTKCKKVLEKIKNDTYSHNPHKSTIKSLKDKELVYTKADKGNKIVVLDEIEYTQRMENLLKNEEFVNIKTNPLNACINTTNKIIKNTKVIPEKDRYKLKNSNPRLPRIYGLPKIHKPGSKMRPIISSIDSPTYNIAKWLVKKFNSITRYESLSIINSFDLAEKIKNMNISENERMVSFDVTALFPSIPQNKLIDILREWLTETGMEKNEIEEYIKLTSLCIEQNFFTYNGTFYQQKSGLAMGNPLSPFLADLYMSHFEIHITKSFPQYFKAWHRYVDDIFAIVSEKHIGDALKLLNIQENAIKFTIEEEENGKLPFLDLLLIRNESKIQLGIYRKATHTENYIKNDSYNPEPHKQAIYNSLIHRLTNLPLSKEEYNKEYRRIKNIAEQNGFNSNTIDKKIQRCNQKKVIRETSTLSITREKTTYKKFTFHPKYHYKFKKIFKEFNITLAPVNKCSIKNLLNCNKKDKIPDENKSGIYQMNCYNCNKIYIGQTKRNIKTRAKEHIRNIKNVEIDKSAVANHCWTENHEIDPIPKLLKSINGKDELSTWEDIFIIKNKDDVMNFEVPAEDVLTRFLNTPIDGESNVAVPVKTWRSSAEDEN